MKATRISLDLLVPRELPKELWGSIRFHIDGSDAFITCVDMQTRNGSSVATKLAVDSGISWERFLECIAHNIINVIKENEIDAHLS